MKLGLTSNFWENFGVFIKEGIASDPGESEILAPLVRFHTTSKPKLGLLLVITFSA